MLRNLSVLVAMSIVGVALLAFAHHGPENITIDAAKSKKAAVDFPHAAHQKLVEKCSTCHHTQEELTAESEVEVAKCSSCHLNPADKAVPSMSEMSLTKNPLHVSCVSCHKTQGKGPTKCDDCHPKG